MGGSSQFLLNLWCRWDIAVFDIFFITDFTPVIRHYPYLGTYSCLYLVA